jgi:hypothetical protein
MLAVESIVGQHKICNRLKLIWGYQIFAFSFELVLSVSVAVAFYIRSGEWHIQFIMTSSRLQIFVVEQIIITISLVFSIKYEHLKNSLISLIKHHAKSKKVNKFSKRKLVKVLICADRTYWCVKYEIARSINHIKRPAPVLCSAE